MKQRYPVAQETARSCGKTTCRPLSCHGFEIGLILRHKSSIYVILLPTWRIIKSIETKTAIHPSQLVGVNTFFLYISWQQESHHHWSSPPWFSERCLETWNHWVDVFGKFGKFGNRFLNPHETSDGESHPLLAWVPWAPHAVPHDLGGLPEHAESWWEITCNSSDTHQQIKTMEFNRHKITEWHLEVSKALNQQHV